MQWIYICPDPKPRTARCTRRILAQEQIMKLYILTVYSRLLYIRLLEARLRRNQDFGADH
ncbi:hypothetical protein BJY01DRAFT_220082 [Aspergillus pseudoustus]|uniref:Uncharacterized protein n=1 Tax=Aspergillus pseudoustus TaxID=1810923 RepID=A0ABR4JE08_9EURO